MPEYENDKQMISIMPAIGSIRT